MYKHIYVFPVCFSKKMLNFSALSISDNYNSLTDPSKAVKVDKADTDEDHDNDLGDEEEQLNKSAEQTRTENDYTRVTGTTSKDYEFQCTHISLEAAKKAIENGEIGEQHWTRAGQYSTKAGDKISYTCRSFPKCPRKLQLHLDPENQDVHIHMSTDSHDHDMTAKRFRLHPLSRQFVLDLINNGCGMPRKILKALQKNNLPPLTKMQINNLKLRCKTKV